MITGLQSFTMKPSPVSPPLHVWECILTTHWAGASKLTASAPGYSRDSTSYVDREFLGVGESTHGFFYPAVLESIIRHGGYHSLVWKPACTTKIQDKPSAVDSSEGWRRCSASYPSGVFWEELVCMLYHLWLLSLIWATSLRPAFQFPKIQVRILKTLFVLVLITVVNAEGNVQAVLFLYLFMYQFICICFGLMCSHTDTDRV